MANQQTDVFATVPKRIGDFSLKYELGKGTFSSVRQGVHELSGLKVAIKITPTKQARESKTEKKESAPNSPVQSQDILASTFSHLETLQREIKLLLRLRHPNVMKVYQTISSEDFEYVVL